MRGYQRKRWTKFRSKCRRPQNLEKGHYQSYIELTNDEDAEIIGKITEDMKQPGSFTIGNIMENGEEDIEGFGRQEK